MDCLAGHRVRTTFQEVVDLFFSGLLCVCRIGCRQLMKQLFSSFNFCKNSDHRVPKRFRKSIRTRLAMLYKCAAVHDRIKRFCRLGFLFSCFFCGSSAFSWYIGFCIDREDFNQIGLGISALWMKANTLNHDPLICFAMIKTG